MSSPRLNNTIVIGCIAMYLLVFMFGLDGNLISPDRYSSNCQVRSKHYYYQLLSFKINGLQIVIHK